MGVRVHTLAKELGLSSKDLVDKLASLDVTVKGHMSVIEDDVARLVKDKILNAEKKSHPSACLPAHNVQEGDAQAETKQPAAPLAAEQVAPARNIPQEAPPKGKTLILRPPVAVRQLAEGLGVKVNDLIKELMHLKVFAAINQALSQEIATKAAQAFGYELVIEEHIPEKEEVTFENEEKDDPSKLKPRSPVVTLMGHVDHGKTSLLDRIRKTNVAGGEHGGITQHIGAYEVFLEKGRVVFLDTPGHQAFTAMRARGANATDVVVLVVAADDSVMPQTKEAVDHARAAKVPIVVAINKIDKPNANVDRVKKDLMTLDLAPEDWGGKTIAVPVSAISGEGVDDLLELLLLETEMLELKANPDKAARGVVIEAHISKGRGPVATVLVQDGTLHVGDIVVCGMSYGRARALVNDRGKNVKAAEPATPIEIAGLSIVPMAGERFTVVKNEKTAREYCQKIDENRTYAERMKKANQVTLENLYEHISRGKMKELSFIIKADVQGSMGVLKDTILKIESPEVKINIIHDGIGGINESDIMLAAASKAIVLGFHVRPSVEAETVAQKESVQIRCYTIIYELLDDLKLGIQGMLDPTYQEQVIGRCVVKQTFKVSKVGTIAGCYVQKGKIQRSAKIRVIRDDVEMYSGNLSSLKRFKDDVREVQQNFECGLSIDNFQDLREGDILEAFILETVKIPVKT